MVYSTCNTCNILFEAGNFCAVSTDTSAADVYYIGEILSSSNTIQD